MSTCSTVRSTPIRYTEVEAWGRLVGKYEDGVFRLDAFAAAASGPADAGGDRHRLVRVDAPPARRSCGVLCRRRADPRGHRRFAQSPLARPSAMGPICGLSWPTCPWQSRTLARDGAACLRRFAG